VPFPQMAVGWRWLNWGSATTYVIYGLATSQLGQSNRPIIVPGAIKRDEHKEQFRQCIAKCRPMDLSLYSQESLGTCNLMMACASTYSLVPLCRMACFLNTVGPATHGWACSLLSCETTLSCPTTVSLQMGLMIKHAPSSMHHRPNISFCVTEQCHFALHVLALFLLSFFLPVTSSNQDSCGHWHDASKSTFMLRHVVQLPFIPVHKHGTLLQCCAVIFIHIHMAAAHLG
jgi:hypothetical protein